MSKLEERRQKQVGQRKSSRNLIIGVVILAVILVFAITPSKKEDACNCVKFYDKWKSNGAGFGVHSYKLTMGLDRCRRKFDGINNARRICNE